MTPEINKIETKRMLLTTHQRVHCLKILTKLNNSYLSLLIKKRKKTKLINLEIKRSFSDRP